MNLQPGSLLKGGEYKIERVLGQGGFGITYLGIQTGLNRKVAIKEFFMRDYCNRNKSTSHITIGSNGSRELVKRFLKKFKKEAQTIAGLKNLHIIRIYDIFEDNNTVYYIMEYISGGSLKDKVSREGALSETDALAYIRQIADALDYIHGQKILHLDVKPANVLLEENNIAIMIDFGISKRYDEVGGQTSSTPIGTSKGYAPLEQYKQSEMNNFAPSTDIYSLGATLYYLLTAQQPSKASDLIDDGLPTMPSHISTTTIQAIESAMQPGRRNRPQSIKEFLALLDKEEDEEMEVIVIQSQPEELRQSKEVKQQNEENNIPMVDLGLSVKWAAWNMGATAPEKYGSLYGWADPTGTKVSTKNDDYPSTNPPKNICSTRYDIARAKWGGHWRLPSLSEIKELKDKCKWEWTIYKNIKGYKVTGPSGKSIFLPAAGYRRGMEVGTRGTYGYYWSGALNENVSDYSYCLYFSSGYVDWRYSGRYSGRSVRPVTE